MHSNELLINTAKHLGNQSVSGKSKDQMTLGLFLVSLSGHTIVVVVVVIAGSGFFVC